MKFKICIPKLPETKSLKYRSHFKSYSDYNYISGKFSIFKRFHFYEALKLSQSFFKKNLVAIDYGCADGFFSFTLSKYYKKIIGMDIDKEYLKFAEKTKKKNNIINIEFIDIEDINPSSLKKQIRTEKISVIYCLEVIEHIYEHRFPYEIRVKKIKELLDFLSDDGILIISVPIMIGFSLLLKFLISRTFEGVNREKISMMNMLRAVFLKDTKNLQQEYAVFHTGFNHKYLEYHLKKCGIKIEKIHYSPFKLNIGLNFGVLYLIRKKF